VNKQPVVLTMFASEVKRWVDNHQLKGDNTWLFPSPQNSSKTITLDAVSTALWNARERLGINKNTNPHWLRHSGLSYCANDLNYNEQLLMWRAGWKNTTMAKRYIHSGAELEGRAYLQRMYAIEEEKPITIKPKTCPHCNALNPYTNTNCDLCAYPLDLEEYKEEVKREERFMGLFPEKMSVNAFTDLNLRQPIAKGYLTFKKKKYMKKIEDFLSGLRK